jgi:hypothetical protein
MDMKQSKRKNIRQERKKVGLVFPNIVLCVCACVCVFICKNKTLHARANSSSSKTRNWWFVCSGLLDFDYCWLRFPSRLKYC